MAQNPSASHRARLDWLSPRTVFAVVLAGTLTGGQEHPALAAGFRAPVLTCSTSTLTSDEFLKKLHAVAVNGDLRDVPFIEKTFGVKMYGGPTYEDNDNADHQKRYYYGTIPGTGVELDLRIRGQDGHLRQSIAALNVLGDYFYRCSPFTQAQIDSVIVGNSTLKTFGLHSQAHPEYASTHHDIALGVGKDGTYIHAVYSVGLAGANYGHVSVPGLLQFQNRKQPSGSSSNPAAAATREPHS